MYIRRIFLLPLLRLFSQKPSLFCKLQLLKIVRSSLKILFVQTALGLDSLTKLYNGYKISLNVYLMILISIVPCSLEQTNFKTYSMWHCYIIFYISTKGCLLIMKQTFFLLTLFGPFFSANLKSRNIIIDTICLYFKLSRYTIS